MVSTLIESDPELAHLHALSAARRAGRIAVVRETLAITAYATGDFALALRELRTYRRISGSNDQLALMVDSERGVGRPDRALELGRSVERSSLPNEVQVSLAIAMSGARLDLQQPEAALAELEIPQLDPDRAFSWSPDLFHAYAEVLEELGEHSDAEVWRERATRAEAALDAAAAVDEHETMDIVEEDILLDDVYAEGDESDEALAETNTDGETDEVAGSAVAETAADDDQTDDAAGEAVAETAADDDQTDEVAGEAAVDDDETEGDESNEALAETNTDGETDEVAGEAAAETAADDETDEVAGEAAADDDETDDAAAEAASETGAEGESDQEGDQQDGAVPTED